MSCTSLLLTLTSLVAGCAASARPESDAHEMHEAAMDAEPMDAFERDATVDATDDLASDASDALPVFEDGAECRTLPYLVGADDCRRVFQARGLQELRFLDTFICCAGRCFLGSSCLTEAPSRARCDLAERTCNSDELCCRLLSGRYDCRDRATHECRPVPDGF